MNKDEKQLFNEMMKVYETNPDVMLYMEALMKSYEEKDKEIDIMKKYFQMIIDLGYDYDGFNNVEDLKGLIDDLCKYANLGKECNTTETIYVNGNKKYNILGEELGGDDNG